MIATRRQIARSRDPLVHRREGDRCLGARVARAASWWEWRIFAPTLAEPRGTDLKFDPPEPATTERWVVSPCSSFSVRLRNEQLEIRRLERIDRRGLELWRVIHRFRFPIDAAALDAVCVNLGVDCMNLAGPIDVEMFLAAMKAAAPQVGVVSVTARRTRFRLDGCHGEHVVLTVGDDQWETMAISGQDPGRVHAALERLHYSQLANMNYPRVLKLIIGMADRASIS